MSPTTNHAKRLLAGAFAAALLIATIPSAQADPTPGSTGRVFGPPLPVAAAKAAVKKSTRTASKTSAKKSASRATSKALPGLGQGARGDAILAMQTRLSELKYDVEVTGIFDYTTLQAVLGFQKVNDLPRTGRATTAMLEVLAGASDPVPLIPTGGLNRIEVDLKKQYLGLYKEGALFKLLPISSGSGKDFCVTDPETSKTECDKAVTPGGSFRIRSRIIGWRESKLGLLYNPLYFNGGIAFHGAPVVPAEPASHGCVRIPMPSAEWFPSEVANGTAVYVFGADKAPVPLGEKAPTDLRPNATAPTTTIDPALTIPGGATTTVVGAVSSTSTVAGAVAATSTVAGATPATVLAGPSTSVVAPTVSPSTLAATTTLAAATTLAATTTVATSTTVLATPLPTTTSTVPAGH